MCVEHDRKCPHPAEVLEQQGLPLHHRQPGARSDVPQPEDARAVGDHRDRVRLVGVREHLVRVLRDLPARGGHPGCVPDPKVSKSRHPALYPCFDLPAVKRMPRRGELPRDLCPALALAFGDHFLHRASFSIRCMIFFIRAAFSSSTPRYRFPPAGSMVTRRGPNRVT